MIHRTSLSKTIDEIHAAHLNGRKVGSTERREAALWIAARQGLPGAYAETFDGFAAERVKGIVLFTGEFPFWYTVLALSEIDCAEAKAELRYAAPELSRVTKRPLPSALYAARRYELAVRVLNDL